MASPTFRGDYFDRARVVAAGILLMGAVLATAGSFLDWVSIDPPATPQGRKQASEPFTGVEARDGWIVVGAAAVMVLAGAGLIVRRRGFYAGLGLAASIVAGAIAIADYRAVGDLRSDISFRMDIVGDADPAIGITLVALGSFAAFVGAILGLVATPAGRKLD
jgi:hypothetical protein